MKTPNNTQAARILIGIGFMLLSLHFWFPLGLAYMGTWPMILTVIGILITVLSKFRHPMGYALTLIGAVFLFKTELPLDTFWYILPLVFIISGILTMFVTKGSKSSSNPSWGK